MLHQLFKKSELAKIKYLYRFHYDKNNEPAIEKYKVVYVNPDIVVLAVPGCTDVIVIRLDEVFEDFEEFASREDFAVIMASSIRSSFSIYFYKNPSDIDESIDHLTAYMIERMKSVYQGTLKIEESHRNLIKHYTLMTKERESGLEKCKKKKKEIYDLLVSTGTEIPDFIKEDQENG